MSLPELLERAYHLAATRRMADTRRANVEYRIHLCEEILTDIIRDLEPLPEMDPDADSFEQIEDDMDEILQQFKDG